MKDVSRLKRVLDQGGFAVTAECGPPKGADAEAILKKAELLKSAVDAVNVILGAGAHGNHGIPAARYMLKKMILWLMILLTILATLTLTSCGTYDPLTIYFPEGIWDEIE